MYPAYEEKKKINGGSVARIVIWSVVLVILVGVLVFGLLFNGEWSLQGINIGSYHYDDADYSVGSGSTREIVTDMEVFWPAGEISIVPSDTDEVVITEEFDGDDDLRLRWCVENGVLQIKYRSPVKFGNTSAPSKKLTIAIPEEMLSSMRNVDLELVSADLSIEGMSAHDVDIMIVSGRVDVQCGVIDSLDVKTGSGDVKVTGSVREADFESGSAELVLHLDDRATAVNLDTFSGDLSVFLPETVSGFEVEMDSVGGSVSVDGFDNVTKTRDECRYGDGRVRIEVDAVSGSIKIAKSVAD